jgi:hypothetical protein
MVKVRQTWREKRLAREEGSNTSSDSEESNTKMQQNEDVTEGGHIEEVI